MPPGVAPWPTPGVYQVADPSTTKSRHVSFIPLIQLSPQPLHLYGGAYSFGDPAENQPIPPSSLHGEEGSSFPGFVPFNDTVDSKSVVGIKPGDWISG